MGIDIVDHKISQEIDSDSVEQDLKNVITAKIRSTRLSDSPNVKSIYFETYENLAKELMEKIKTEAEERFRVSDVSMTHRVGHIPVGEYSFTVSVSARRIDDAFSACKFIVEEINSELPVWKYEEKTTENE